MNGPAFLRQSPFFLALIAVLWCVWIGLTIWQTPRVMEGVRIETAADGSQITVPLREVRTFADVSMLGFIPLAIPFLLACGVAMTARLEAPDFMAVFALLFLGFVFVTGFSIGGGYSGPASVLAAATLLEAGFALRAKRHAISPL